MMIMLNLKLHFSLCICYSILIFLIYSNKLRKQAFEAILTGTELYSDQTHIVIRYLSD